MNILKPALLILFTSLSTVIYSQNWSFEIAVPLVSHKLTNVEVIKSDLNKAYLNDYHIPNFRFNSKYKKISVGLDYYHHSYHFTSIGSQEFSSNSIDNNINTLSLLLGYELFDSKIINLSAGSGISYQQQYLNLFLSQYSFEGYGFFEYNKLGATFWFSAKAKIYKNINIAANIRYNPMFNPYFDDTETYNIEFYDHDRLNYLISQISIGYQF